MSTFRRVTDHLSVAGQIRPEDVAQAARQGFRLIINNRPDGEEPGQPANAEVEAAAAAEGLAYAHLPVRGMPTPEQVETQRKLIDQADGPVLAFCRTGNRCIVTWAVGEAQAGRRSPQEITRLGAEAGYDLSRLF